MTDKIELLDSIMGSGKSTKILEWCESQPNTPFLYITPLLSESEVRVVEACSNSKFIAPSTEQFKTKGEHLLDLLYSGVNISITHSLYSSLRKEHLVALKENRYTLILDEEVSFVSPLGDGYSVSDFKYLKDLKQIDVDETDGKILWLNEDIGENTKYTKLANMCRLGMVYQSKRSDNWFVTQLPMDLIQYAERAILLTYLFKGSILDSFLKLKRINVIPFTEVTLDKGMVNIKDLIEFVGERQVQDWAGESFSASWYLKSTQPVMTKLSKSIRSVGDSCKAPNADLLWCTPSHLARPVRKSARKVAPSGYSAGTGDINESGVASGCFLPCSSRATNAYRDRSVLVHCYNRFPHLSVSSFLQDYGCTVDNNQFALSELVQWVWRSQIRDGKPIKLCILSKRMRKLFQEWLDSLPE